MSIPFSGPAFFTADYETVGIIMPGVRHKNGEFGTILQVLFLQKWTFLSIFSTKMVILTLFFHCKILKVFRLQPSIKKDGTRTHSFAGFADFVQVAVVIMIVIPQIH